MAFTVCPACGYPTIDAVMCAACRPVVMNGRPSGVRAKPVAAPRSTTSIPTLERVAAHPA